MARLKKSHDIVIYRDPRYYCGPGPSSVLLENGRILTAFRRAQDWTSVGVIAHGFPSTEACLTHSDDEGESWSEPVVFTSGNITNQNLMRMPNGVLLCLTQRAEMVPLKVFEDLRDRKPFHHDEHFGWAYASYGVQAMRSHDEGATWEGPYYLSPIPEIEPVFDGWPSPAGLRASPIILDKNTVGVAVYGISGGDGKRWGNVWLMTSSDSGVTWAPRGCIIADPDGTYYPNETGLQLCKSGKLIAFMRVEYGQDRMLCTSESNDNGFTWSPMERRAIKGHPFQAARLTTGGVLLAYGYRHDPMGVRARLLDADCENIDTAEELIIRADGGSFDLGYPHVLSLNDGRALIMYYHNVDNRIRYIAGSITCSTPSLPSSQS